MGIKPRLGDSLDFWLLSCSYFFPRLPRSWSWQCWWSYLLAMAVAAPDGSMHRAAQRATFRAAILGEVDAGDVC